MIDHVAVAADHGDLHTGDGQHLTRVGDHVLVLSRGQNLLVSSIDPQRFVPGLGIDVGSVIDEGSYGDFVDQLGDATGVVIVIVGQQHVVDLADTGALGCSKNPVRITTIVVGPPCVNEQRLPGRGYKECGLAALDIDEVDPKITLGRRCGQARQKSGNKGEQDSYFDFFAGDESSVLPASSRLRTVQQECWRPILTALFGRDGWDAFSQASPARTGTGRGLQVTSVADNRRDLTHLCISDGRIRIAKLRMVEDVKCFETELDHHLFTNGEVLEERLVKICAARTDQ